MVSKETVLEAVKSVLGLKPLNGKTNNLLGDASGVVFLDFEFAYDAPIPQNEKSISFKVPHRTFPTELDVCMIVREPKAHWKEMASNLSENTLQKVTTVGRIFKKCYNNELKDSLRNAYQLFILDDYVLPKKYLPVLGHKFMKRNRPIPISLREVFNSEQLDKALTEFYKSVHLQILPKKYKYSVKVGTKSQSPEEIAENIVEALSQLRTSYGEHSVQEAGIRVDNSLVYPIWLDTYSLEQVANANTTLGTELYDESSDVKKDVPQKKKENKKEKKKPNKKENVKKEQKPKNNKKEVKNKEVTKKEARKKDVRKKKKLEKKSEDKKESVPSTKKTLTVKQLILLKKAKKQEREKLKDESKDEPKKVEPKIKNKTKSENNKSKPKKNETKKVQEKIEKPKQSDKQKPVPKKTQGNKKKDKK